MVLDILFAEERCSSSLLSQGVVDAWSDRSFAPKSFVRLPRFDALVDPLIWNLDGLSWLEVEKGLERFSLLASLVGLFDGRLGRLKSS